MSKYEPLWKYIVAKQPEVLNFDEVEKICGFAIDHSFLTYKKELLDYGFCVKKVSIKNKTVYIERLDV